MPSFIDALAEQTGTGLASGTIGGALGEIFGAMNDRRQVSQQHRLTDIQLNAQKNMMDYGYDTQMKMWNATNYPAQMEQLQKAGLNPGLMYAKGGPGGVSGNPVTGSSGGGTQQNPGEIQTAMGIMNQNALMESQRKLMDAQAHETNVKADKEAGVDTAKGIAEINNLTQGLQNLRATEQLTKAQTIMQNLENTIVGHTVKEREDYIVAQTQQAQEIVMQSEQQTFIDRATAHEKVDIIQRDAIGKLLQNQLTEMNIKVEQAQINKMAQDIAQGWKDLQLKGQAIDINAFSAQIQANFPSLGQSLGHILNNAKESIEQIFTGKGSPMPYKIKK